jgi:hypothetical protein
VLFNEMFYDSLGAVSRRVGAPLARWNGGPAWNATLKRATIGGIHDLAPQQAETGAPAASAGAKEPVFSVFLA